MTWKRGRQLTTLQTEENSIQYKYDSDSIRTSKIVDGVVHTYEYLGGLLMHETRGTQAYDYYYDANGQLYAVSYKLSATDTKKVYYFTHNWRGDIVGIYNGNGDLKATYSYDAWGNVLSIEDADGNAITSATHIANLNPFRYRGYYQDTETGLYYLMSRYYDPVTHRFVNADGYFQSGGDILDSNMNSYCRNNPVNYFDPTGNACEDHGRFYIPTCGTCTHAMDEYEEKLKVGAASSYNPSYSKEYNCYAYALGETEWKYVGGSAGTVTDFNIDVVSQMVLDDAQRDGRTMRIIESYDSPIKINEYRIALRTGESDYHFMIQHNDGSWSHKPGYCKTRLIDGDNPSEVSWDVPVVNQYALSKGIVLETDYISNYYNSKTVYFAVSK